MRGFRKGFRETRAPKAQDTRKVGSFEKFRPLSLWAPPPFRISRFPQYRGAGIRRYTFRVRYTSGRALA